MNRISIFFLMLLFSFTSYSQFVLKKRPLFEESKHIKPFNSSLKTIATDKQKLEEYFYELWNSEVNDWVLDEKYTLFYNDENRIKEEVSYKWDINDNTWLFQDKAEYSYNTAGLVSQEVWYGWDEETKAWYYTSKTEFFYNSDNNLELEVDYLWNINSSEWTNSSKESHTYNSNKDLLEEIRSYWYPSTKEWQLSNKSEYYYNENNILTIKKYLLWYSENWNLSDKYEYSYNAEGKLIEDVYYRWANNQWTYREKREYSYDLNQNIIQLDHSYFDTETNEWGNNTKEVFTYDNNYTHSDLITPFYIPLEYVNHMLVTITGSEMNEEGTNLINDKKITFTYSGKTASLTDKKDNDLRIYPNPATEFLIIESEHSFSNSVILLFNSEGQKKLTQEVLNANKISLDGIDAGFYFYSIQLNGKTQSGKLIVK